MDQKTLRIGDQVEVLRGTRVEMVDDAPMTLGDLLVQVLPNAPTRPEDGVRVWRLAIEIDRAKGLETFALSPPDFDLLRSTALAGERPTWVMWNLSRLFDGVGDDMQSGNG